MNPTAFRKQMENENKLNKSFENGFKPQEDSLGNNQEILNETDINPHLTHNLISLGHLKILLRLKYPSYDSAGKDVGLSATRVRQIVNGFKIPETPELIKQIAKGWDLDPIVLTQLFDRYRGLK